MTSDEVKAVTGQLDKSLTFQVVTLKEYLEKELASVSKYFESRLSENAKALELQAVVLRERFASVNEFRAALTDQAGRFITRDDLQSEVAKICLTNAQLKEDLDTIQTKMDKAEGKAEGKASVWAVVGVGAFTILSFIVSIIALVKDVVK